MKDIFTVNSGGTIDSKGRVTTDYLENNEDGLIRGILALATPQEKARWEQIQHPITHTIVSKGKPKAKEKDMLLHNGRKFFVQGVDEPGELGLTTIYYAEERYDL